MESLGAGARAHPAALHTAAQLLAHRTAGLNHAASGATRGRRQGLPAARVMAPGRPVGAAPLGPFAIQAVAERLRRGVHLLAGHVRVAADGREVGVPQVLGDQSRVARGLAQPRRGGVAQRVGGSRALRARSPDAAADDVGQDVLLQAPTGQPTEHRLLRGG